MKDWLWLRQLSSPGHGANDNAVDMRKRTLHNTFSADCYGWSVATAPSQALLIAGPKRYDQALRRGASGLEPPTSYVAEKESRKGARGAANARRLPHAPPDATSCREGRGPPLTRHDTRAERERGPAMRRVRPCVALDAGDADTQSGESELQRGRVLSRSPRTDHVRFFLYGKVFTSPGTIQPNMLTTCRTHSWLVTIAISSTSKHRRASTLSSSCTSRVRGRTRRRGHRRNGPRPDRRSSPRSRRGSRPSHRPTSQSSRPRRRPKRGRRVDALQHAVAPSKCRRPEVSHAWCPGRAGQLQKLRPVPPRSDSPLSREQATALPESRRGSTEGARPRVVSATRGLRVDSPQSVGFGVCALRCSIQHVWSVRRRTTDVVRVRTDPVSGGGRTGDLRTCRVGLDGHPGRRDRRLLRPVNPVEQGFGLQPEKVRCQRDHRKAIGKRTACFRVLQAADVQCRRRPPRHFRIERRFARKPSIEPWSANATFNEPSNSLAGPPPGWSSQRRSVRRPLARDAVNVVLGRLPVEVALAVANPSATRRFGFS